MARIPVEKTIGGAYSFLLSNPISIIGIVWLPYLVFGGLAGAIIAFAISHYPLNAVSFDEHHPNFAPLFAFARLMPLVVVCFVLGVFIATIGLTRKALGLMEGPTFVFFTLGAPLWRLVGALLLYMLIVLGVYIVFGVVVGLWVVFGFPRLPHATAVLVSVLGGLFLFCSLIYIAVRLWFFVPAVVVAEEKIGIGRSWQLGGGNFWRIFLVMLIVILPPLIVFGLIQNVLTAFLYGPMPMPVFSTPHPDPKEIFGFYRELFLRLGPPVIALQVLIAIVMRALYAGAVASAYRGVTAARPAE